MSLPNEGGNSGEHLPSSSNASEEVPKKSKLPYRRQYSRGFRIFDMPPTTAKDPPSENESQHFQGHSGALNPSETSVSQDKGKGKAMEQDSVPAAVIKHGKPHGLASAGSHKKGKKKPTKQVSVPATANEHGRSHVLTPAISYDKDKRNSAEQISLLVAGSKHGQHHVVASVASQDKGKSKAVDEGPRPGTPTPLRQYRPEDIPFMNKGPRYDPWGTLPPNATVKFTKEMREWLRTHVMEEHHDAEEGISLLPTVEQLYRPLCSQFFGGREMEDINPIEKITVYDVARELLYNHKYYQVVKDEKIARKMLLPPRLSESQVPAIGALGKPSRHSKGGHSGHSGHSHH